MDRAGITGAKTSTGSCRIRPIRRILDGTARKLRHPESTGWSSRSTTHGNTSAASIPLALDVAVKDGRIKRGDLVLMEAMGGGFTWGAVLAALVETVNRKP